MMRCDIYILDYLLFISQVFWKLTQFCVVVVTQVHAFFENRDVGSGKRAVKGSLEKIQTSIEWLEKNEETVETWLRNQMPRK